MRRNKMVALMEIKRIKYSHQRIKQPYLINHSYSQWEEAYYHKKQMITEIQNTNHKIDELVSAYEQNPSVYNLKVLQKLVHNNCEKINKCDQTLIIQQQYSNVGFMTGTMFTLDENVKKNFRNILFQEIKKLFRNKATISQITNRIEQHERSFNAFNNTQNISYTSLNSRNAFPQQNRQQAFTQVNQQIQGLNMILKRMNVMVYEQGQLINQIDENMKKGTENMTKGRQMLQKRAMREEGTGEFQFSFEGKINQAITALYGVNVFLIVIWVLKNLI